MLTMLAAATAANGTNRCIRGDALWSNKHIHRTLGMTSDAPTNVGKHVMSNMHVRDVSDKQTIQSFDSSKWCCSL